MNMHAPSLSLIKVFMSYVLLKFVKII